MKDDTDFQLQPLCRRVPVVRLDIPPGRVLWEALLNLLPLVEDGKIVLEVDGSGKRAADLLLLPFRDPTGSAEKGRNGVRASAGGSSDISDEDSSRCLAVAWELAPFVDRWAKAWRGSATSVLRAHRAGISTGIFALDRIVLARTG